MHRIRTLDELDDLEEHWRKLDRIEGGTSVFQSWSWNRTWCDYVLPTLKDASLDVRVLEDAGGKVLAILPFFEEPLLGPFASIVQFLGHKMSFHNDILLAEPSDVELADRVIQALLRSLGLANLLHLRHLYEDSVFTKRLLARDLLDLQCPRLWLRTDSTIVDQRTRLGSSRRKSLRLAENRMRRQFDMQFCVKSGVDCSEAFDEFLDLHSQRFDSKGKESLLTAANAEFLKAMTLILGREGTCEIVQLRGNDATIAAALMMKDKSRYFFVNGGFDPAFARFSPMRVLLTETMRRAFDDLGCEIYELGPGYETYKYDWSPNVARNFSFCFGKGLWAKGLATGYRYAFRYQTKSIVPAGFVSKNTGHRVDLGT